MKIIIGLILIAWVVWANYNAVRLTIKEYWDEQNTNDTGKA